MRRMDANSVAMVQIGRSTGPTTTGNRIGGERAKSLGCAAGVVRANKPLRAARAATARLLEVALESTKPIAIAAGMNVTPTLVERWMDVAWCDARPAPLAVLLVLDGDEFERVVQAIRKAREE